MEIFKLAYTQPRDCRARSANWCDWKPKPSDTVERMIRNCESVCYSISLQFWKISLLPQFISLFFRWLKQYMFFGEILGKWEKFKRKLNRQQCYQHIGYWCISCKLFLYADVYRCFSLFFSSYLCYSELRLYYIGLDHTSSPSPEKQYSCIKKRKQNFVSEDLIVRSPFLSL